MICHKYYAKTRKQLAYHIRIHKCGAQYYFDKYLEPEKGKCIVCGGQAIFKSLIEGYRKVCGHKCGGIHFRRELKNDLTRFTYFKEKVKENQCIIWGQRDTNGQKQKIFERVSATQKQKNDALTPEQKRKKFSRYYRCTKKKIKELNNKGKKQLLQNWAHGMGGYKTSTKGLFKCVNSDKYMGNPRNIVYRSSLELKYMLHLDHDPNVLRWGSEECVVNYWSPIDRKQHRYFVDFIVQRRTPAGIKNFLIEIKPKSQTLPPKASKNRKRHFNETATYAINQAKWAAATRYAEQRNMVFQILTEDHLKMTSING